MTPYTESDNTTQGVTTPYTFVTFPYTCVWPPHTPMCHISLHVCVTAPYTHMSHFPTRMCDNTGQDTAKQREKEEEASAGTSFYGAFSRRVSCGLIILRRQSCRKEGRDQKQGGNGQGEFIWESGWNFRRDKKGEKHLKEDVDCLARDPGQE